MKKTIILILSFLLLLIPASAQKKKKQAVKGLEMHVIDEGETLREIAQRYAVRVKSLCRLNGLERENMIREGDIIRLRK